MKRECVAQSADATWYVFGRDPNKSQHVIDTNEYLIVSDQQAMLLDPGGTEIFPQVVSAISEIIPINQITAFLASHQDPDIMSSLPLWMGLCPEAKIYMSWVWSGFIAHFGHEYVDRFHTVPDEGLTFRLGNAKLQIVPAHYCHSSGNFSLFDPSNRVLFSGDIGAALLPPTYESLFVENVASHAQYMTSFHRRWMPSNRAKNAWVKRVRKLNPTYICPQHGAIFKGDQVTQFLDWLEGLQVGTAI